MEIIQTLAPEAADLERLDSEFRGFVASACPGLAAESEDKRFLFSAYEQAEFIGGIAGAVYWNGLEIDTLWVRQDCRRNGIGRELLAAAEDYARDNAAVIAFLKTVDARKFYARAGYRVFGILEDRPIGTLLYHMKKRLDRKKAC